jgi:hypothetical protein
MILFIAVEGESQTVRGGWPVTMVQIQYFSFGSIGRRWDEVLLEDEVEAPRSSWLNKNEA